MDLVHTVTSPAGKRRVRPDEARWVHRDVGTPGRVNLRSAWLIPLALILLCGLHPPAAVRAQAPTPRFTSLTAEQGLSHNAVRCILQDSQGFMWFGTQDGLNRYDGYTFTIYRHRRSDPNSLSSNVITALYQDRAGTLWVGTITGLDSFAGGAARFDHHSAIGEQVSEIYEDAAGNLWIGTEGAGLFRYDRAAGQFTQYLHDPSDPHSLSSDNVSAIYEDSAGILWVGTTHSGLNGFDPVTLTFARYQHAAADPHSLSYDRVTAIYEDRSGVLWVGTGDDYEVEVGGLNAFDRNTGRFTRYLYDPQDLHSLSHNDVKAIYEDQAGALWIGTDDGLNVLDRTANTFVRYHHDPLDPYSLANGRITAIYEDHNGTLWFGTDARGLSRYARVKEKFMRLQPDPLTANGLSGSVIGALYEDRDGDLWIGIHGGGLDRYDRATGQFTHYSHDADDPTSLSHDHVKALCEDHESVLWVGTNQGLDRYERATGQFTHYIHDPGDPNSLGPGAVKVILEDHTHALWIGTEDPGSINRFDMTAGAFTRYGYDPADPNSLINTYGVRAIYEDQAGDLWLGTYNGLVHFDPGAGRFTQYLHDPDDPHSLSHNFVWSIYEDPDRNLWIGTAEGLNRLDRASGQFAVYTMEDGLPNDGVMCILGDQQGNLWLGTDGGGLSRFNPWTETFKNYDVSDGLASNVTMLGVCHRGMSGEMFFGTLNGVTAFYPADVKDNPYVPPIVLTAFRKFDETVELDAPLVEVEEITLSYRDNFFAFEFAALDYTDPARNQYAYQLEGFDKEWIYCGTRRYASYTNLPPGAYIFRVKGTNNDGIWNEEGRAVRVIITPPFWQTWWFRVLAGAIALGVVSAVAVVRMRYVAVLRESEAQFRALFENAPLGVFELDMTSTPPRITRANRQSERVYGWSTAELTSASLDSLFPPDTWPTLERTMSTLSPGKTFAIESTGLRQDGTAFPIRISATGGTGHDLKRAILAIEDITAEKHRRSEEEAIAEERRRIAREIHDGLAQDLAGLRFRVRLWHTLVDDDPAQMHVELDGLRDLLREKIRDVRRSIFALRPVALDELGFYPALRQFIGEFGEQNQLYIDLRITGPPERLPVFLEPVLFRITQESLNNVGKHTQAQMVWIALDLTSPDVVRLRIRDDGEGFDLALLEQAFQRGHLGLKQMRERVENLQGVFELHSQLGSGTEIQVILPLTGEREA